MAVLSHLHEVAQLHQEGPTYIGEDHASRCVQDGVQVAFKTHDFPDECECDCAIHSVKRRRVSSDSEKMGDCQTRCGPILSFIYVVMD